MERIYCTICRNNWVEANVCSSNLLKMQINQKKFYFLLAFSKNMGYLKENEGKPSRLNKVS